MPDWYDLPDEKKTVLNDWHKFFSKRYNIVGKVSWYDEYSSVIEERDFVGRIWDLKEPRKFCLLTFFLV